MNKNSNYYATIYETSKLLDEGRKLSLIKFRVKHGEWESLLFDLGINHRHARRIMQAHSFYNQFSNIDGLLSLGWSKLCILMNIETENIQALINHKMILGLSLEELQLLTTRELKKWIKDNR